MNYSKYIEANEFVEKYFFEIGELFCSRCFKDKKARYHHEQGCFSYFFNCLKLFKKKELDVYFKDLEHGLFHGIFTAMFSLYLVEGKGYSKEEKSKLVVSCILHDILKTIGYSQESHGPALVNYFPNLLEETYRHNLIKNNVNIGPLVKADRIELMRYKDYKDWIDIDLLSFLDINQDILNVIFLKIRPALAYFYKNESSVFIRHGWEEDNFFKKNMYPFFYANETKGEFAIELDSMCFEKNEIQEKLRESCSYHSGGKVSPKWKYIKGYITNEDFFKCNYSLVSDPFYKRDHLYARGHSKIENWIFLTREYDKDYNLYKKHIGNILNSNTILCEDSLFQVFFRCKKIIQNYMKVLLVAFD